MDELTTYILGSLLAAAIFLSSCTASQPIDAGSSSSTASGSQTHPGSTLDIP